MSHRSWGIGVTSENSRHPFRKQFLSSPLPDLGFPAALWGSPLHLSSLSLPPFQLCTKETISAVLSHVYPPTGLPCLLPTTEPAGNTPSLHLLWVQSLWPARAQQEGLWTAVPDS